MPQTTQASSFNEISAPQQLQYAAKDRPQNFTLLECETGVEDSFSGDPSSRLSQIEPAAFSGMSRRKRGFFEHANVIKVNEGQQSRCGSSSLQFKAHKTRCAC